MKAGTDILKRSDEELASGRRMSRHLAIGLKALCIPFVLSGLVLAIGSYLSELINVDPNSILFRLWPFNKVYLQQFAISTYSNSEIRWFFTAVSCSNLIWMTFLLLEIIF